MTTATTAPAPVTHTTDEDAMIAHSNVVDAFGTLGLIGVLELCSDACEVEIDCISDDDTISDDELAAKQSVYREAQELIARACSVLAKASPDAFKVSK